jgi:hypothetical protein
MSRTGLDRSTLVVAGVATLGPIMAVLGPPAFCSPHRASGPR